MKIHYLNVFYHNFVYYFMLHVNNDHQQQQKLYLRIYVKKDNEGVQNFGETFILKKFE